MKDDFLKNWNLMTNKMQKSMQLIMELNAKTLQSFSYLKPGDLSSLKQPDELLSKHIALTVENSQKILDYLHKSFQILESALVSFSKEEKENRAESSAPVRTASESNDKKMKKQSASSAKKTKSTNSAKKQGNASTKQVKKPTGKSKPSKNPVKPSEMKPAIKSALPTGASQNHRNPDMKVDKREDR